MSSTNPVTGEKHFTASVFIITIETPKRVLLLHHKKLDSWLQPGGHVEVFENPLEAVVREAREETSIDISYLLKEINVIDDAAKELPVPRFFLEEKIPARKDQPEHVHLDLFYVAEVPFQVITMNEHESSDLRWFTLEDALQITTFENTKMLLRRLLS